MPGKKRSTVDEMPFHLLFIDSDTLMMKEFTDIVELGNFVALNGLTKSDYGILQGDLIKKMPTRSLYLGEAADEDELDEFCSPESGLQMLTPDSIREFIDEE